VAETGVEPLSNGCQRSSKLAWDRAATRYAVSTSPRPAGMMVPEPSYSAQSSSRAIPDEMEPLRIAVSSAHRVKLLYFSLIRAALSGR
jgi:hypothetical protein